MRRCLRLNQSVRSGWPPQSRRGEPSPKLSTRKTTIAATGPSTLPAGHCRMSKASRPVPGHGVPPLCPSADGIAASETHHSEGPRPRGVETSTTTMAIVLRCSGSSSATKLHSAGTGRRSTCGGLACPAVVHEGRNAFCEEALYPIGRTAARLVTRWLDAARSPP